jgi:hypothetical protein
MKIGYDHRLVCEPRDLRNTKIVVGSVVLLLIMNPAQFANQTQRAILDEYAGLYCTPVAEARKNPLQHSAVAAAMSRIVVKAGLGSMALAEYARCKVLN